MFAAAFITAGELGKMMRPHAPFTRQTIAKWTREGRFPAGTVEHRGRYAWYCVPKLIDAGWLMPEPANAPA